VTGEADLRGDGIRFLAISGSLRAASSNRALLRAAALLAPPGVQVAFFEGLEPIPAFNPDVEQQGIYPPAVMALRQAVAAADAVLISSPEYAHGVPGVLKNALDWLVGSGELVDKRVALLNPSPRSLFAHAQLAEILTTMSALLVPEASLTIQISGLPLDAEGIAAHPAFARAIGAALAALKSSAG
jgi:chromate reductase